MFSKINSLGLFGMNAFPIEVEIEISKGMPYFDIVGLADTAVKESRERVKSALRSCGFAFPLSRVVVNLAPADTKKTGSSQDFAIGAALLSVMGHIDSEKLKKSALVGELSLSGDLRAINGILPMTILALKQGFKEIYVPYDNAHEASVIEGIDVFGIKNISEFVDHIEGRKPLNPTEKYEIHTAEYFGDLDFSDVKGQSTAKKALEVAASGGHNVLMIGTPGSGKSMLAKRLPSILPAMTFEESIETTNIYSIAGELNSEMPLVVKRPFRSPHHTTSQAGLVGGGSIPKPGDISLSHNGLLFLDEFAEFPKSMLELLRQPLEDQKITISRALGTVTYPCSFMLVAAMNPCPCGYYGHPSGKCSCSSKQISSYLSRVSGPMLDRFDLHIEVAPVDYESISSAKKEESSAQIRERVQRAREIQNERFKGTGITCNARITSDIVAEVCVMDSEAESFMKSVFEKLGLSARAYDRIRKVARTIADLQGSDIIKKTHVAQAVQYRSLDRKYWH